MNWSESSARSMPDASIFLPLWPKVWLSTSGRPAHGARGRGPETDCEGDRNRDIGEHLESRGYRQGSRQRIMDKLGAKDRTQAVAIGIRRGVIAL